MFSAMVTEFGGVPMLYEIDSDEATPIALIAILSGDSLAIDFILL